MHCLRVENFSFVLVDFADVMDANKTKKKTFSTYFDCNIDEEINKKNCDEKFSPREKDRENNFVKTFLLFFNQTN